MSANPVSKSIMETLVASDASDVEQIRQQYVTLKRKFDDQAKKLVAVELAQRAAEDESRRVKEELEARRNVNSTVLEKRVEEAVLKAQASEVAKRRKAEQELDKLKKDLTNAITNNGALKNKLASAVEQLSKQEERYKEWAKQEIQKYKKAAKAAWRGAEDEVAKLENQIVSLREENEKLLTRISGTVAAQPAADVDISSITKSVASAETEGLKSKIDSTKSGKERLRDVYGPFLGEHSVSEMDVPTIDDAPVKTGMSSATPTPVSTERVSSDSEKDLFDHLDHLEKVEGSKEALSGYIDPTKKIDLGESVIKNTDEMEADEIEDDFAVILPGAPAGESHGEAPERLAPKTKDQTMTAPHAADEPAGAQSVLDAFSGVDLDGDRNTRTVQLEEADIRTPADSKHKAKKSGGILRWIVVMLVLMAGTAGGAYYFLTNYV